LRNIQIKKKLFITDFDRTLLRDDKTLAKKDVNGLIDLQEQGIVTCIATGRSVFSFNKTLKTFAFDASFKLPIDYLIFSTGAGIMNYNTGRIIKSFSLLEPDVVLISDYFESLKLDYMVHKPVPDTHCFVYKSHGTENPDFFNRIKLYKEYSSEIPQGKKLNGFKESTEILAVLPHNGFQEVSENNFEIIKKIKQDLSQFSVIIATSPLDNKSFWIEVFNKGVSKSQAAAFIANRLSIQRENVVSIGNDYNDKDLLDWSGKGFVVENALDELKEIFEQTPSNNSLGVSTAVQKCIKL